MDSISGISQSKVPVLYCWRGGLRSLSLSQILYFSGIPSLRLKGGYKAYRRFIYNSLNNYHLDSRPVVLHGLTGTGKTLIIKRLLAAGCPAIDLEGLALHRGSVFGKIGFDEIRTQKDFEAMLWSHLDKLNNSPFIVFEKEGRKIGPIFLPSFLNQSMEEGLHILLEAPPEIRAERIVAEYVKKEMTEAQKKQFITGINSLTHRLGKERTKQLIKFIETEDYYEAALILCRDYYDKFYFDARPERYDYAVRFDATSVESVTRNIADYLDNKFDHYPDNKIKYNMQEAAKSPLPPLP